MECLADEDSDNEEGYSAAWLHEEKPSVGVWEMLREGKELSESKSGMPAEFRAWLEGLESRIPGEYRELEQRALEAFRAYPGPTDDSKEPEQSKQFAAYAVE